jgi:hypothetical protein
MPELLEPNGSGSVIGLDTGFRRDPSAGVIVRTNGGAIEIAEVIEIRPAKGERLVPSKVIAQLNERAQYHSCTYAVVDQFYVESVREHMKVSLREAPGGAVGKAETHVAVRTLFNEGRIRISAKHTRLMQQLREIVSRPLPGGGLSITSPRRGGAHGDIASAAILAIWECAKALRWLNYPVRAPRDPMEAIERDRKRRLAALHGEPNARRPMDRPRRGTWR